MPTKTTRPSVKKTAPRAAAKKITRVAKAATPASKAATPATKAVLAAKASVPPRPAAKATAGKTVFNIEGSTSGLRISILNHLKFTLARDIRTARPRDWWLCLSYAVRDRMLERFITTQGEHNRRNVRRVYYFSLEYLMGRLLRDALHNTGLYAS